MNIVTGKAGLLAVAVVVVATVGAGARSVSARAELQEPGAAFEGQDLTEPLTVTMVHIAESLGVACAYCHADEQQVGDGDPAVAAQAASRREIARMMMEMVRDINARYINKVTPTPAGVIKWGRVNCYTCHRGTVYPER